MKSLKFLLVAFFRSLSIRTLLIFLFSIILFIADRLLLVYTPSSIVDGLVESKINILSFVLVVILVVSGYMNGRLQLMSQKELFRFRLKEISKLQLLAIRIPLSYIETGDAKQKIDGAEQAVAYGNDQGIESCLSSIQKLIMCSISIILYFLPFYKVPAWLLIIVLVTMVVNYFISHKIYINLEQAQEAYNESRYRDYYLQRVIQSNEQEMSIRMLNASDRLLDKLRAEQSKSVGFIEYREKLNFTSRFFRNILSVFRTGILLYLLITYVKIDVAGFVLYLGIFLTIDNLLDEFHLSIDNIKAQLPFIKKWHEFYKTPYVEKILKQNNTEHGSVSAVLGNNSADEKHSDVLLEIDKLYFSYPGGRELYKGLSIEVKEGERIAIIGKNGCGKTTLVKLLAGLCTPSSGSVKINSNSSRPIVSAALQEDKLFSFTLRENLIFDRTSACSDERIMDVLTSLGLMDRIMSLPDKLDTYVGRELDDNGVNFSGGESQRILIARALLYDSDILLMDEPTAALDVKSEYDLYKGIEKLAGNRTIFFVSHRLASTRLCNRIIFFDDERIVIGTHEELYREVSAYREMYDIQADVYLSKEEV